MYLDESLEIDPGAFEGALSVGRSGRIDPGGTTIDAADRFASLAALRGPPGETLNVDAATTRRPAEVEFVVFRDRLETDRALIALLKRATFDVRKLGAGIIRQIVARDRNERVADRGWRHGFAAGATRFGINAFELRRGYSSVSPRHNRMIASDLHATLETSIIAWCIRRLLPYLEDANKNEQKMLAQAFPAALIDARAGGLVRYSTQRRVVDITGGAQHDEREGPLSEIRVGIATPD